MKMNENPRRWHLLKIFFPARVLLAFRNKEKFTTTWHNFACGLSPCAYVFFKHVLEEWYPLGLKLLIQTELKIYEEEGINKSTQKFLELKEFLKEKIQKKEKKLWKNILNQYSALYGSQDASFSLDRAVFKLEITPKTERQIVIRLKKYLSLFINDQLLPEFEDIGLITYSKQMNALLEYIHSRLKNGDSMCGFSIKEEDFLKWWLINNKTSFEELIPFFEKRYNFLELLLVLDFTETIQLRRIRIERVRNKHGKELPIDMIWGNFNILKDISNLDAEIIKKSFQEKGQLPFCIEEGGVGYLKFGKYGKKKKIGRVNSRHFRLLNTLLSPIGVFRTVDSIFEEIKIPKDTNDSLLSDWNNEKTRKIQLIKYTIKELQKNNKLEGRIEFEFNKNNTQIRAKLLE